MTTAHRKHQMLRIAFLLMGLYALLVVRLFHVQVTTADTYAERQYRVAKRPSYRQGRTDFERARRGTIRDCRGQTLAVSYDEYRVMVDPSLPHRFREPREDGKKGYTLEERADLLMGVLDDLGVEFSRQKVFDRITTVTVQRERKGEIVDVPVRSRNVVRGLLPLQKRYIQNVMKELRIRNFFFEAEAHREYPEGDLFVEVVGYLSADPDDAAAQPKGGAGIEHILDDVLTGKGGIYTCEVDGRGREFDVEGDWIREPVNGRDVELTLDARVQLILEKALTTAMVENPTAKRATGVVVETRTGRVLGMRSLPCASLDDLRGERAKPGDLRCRAVTDLMVPGSTVKPFFLSKAVEYGVVNWSDRFDTNNGRYVFRHENKRRALKDSKRHGILDVREIIIVSSNIGMAMICYERMGVDLLYRVIEEWGFGDRPGVLMPYQPGAILPSRAAMKKNPLSAAVSVPFGHEMNISPLALTAKMSVFGNEGVYCEPTVVSRIGRVGAMEKNTRGRKLMVDPDVAADVLEVMAVNVTDGTATCLSKMPWTAAAKTGTAQVVEKSGVTGRYNSSVIALAPVVDTRITVYIGLFDLEGSGPEIYAGSTAGPAVREVIEKTLGLFGTRKDNLDAVEEEK